MAKKFGGKTGPRRGFKRKNVPGYYLGVDRIGRHSWRASRRIEKIHHRDEFFKANIPAGTIVALNRNTNAVVLGFHQGKVVVYNPLSNSISHTSFGKAKTVIVRGHTASNFFHTEHGLLSRKVLGTDLRVKDILNKQNDFKGFKPGEKLDLKKYKISARVGDVLKNHLGHNLRVVALAHNHIVFENQETGQHGAININKDKAHYTLGGDNKLDVTIKSLQASFKDGHYFGVHTTTGGQLIKAQQMHMPEPELHHTGAEEHSLAEQAKHKPEEKNAAEFDYEENRRNRYDHSPNNPNKPGYRTENDGHESEDEEDSPEIKIPKPIKPPKNLPKSAEEEFGIGEKEPEDDEEPEEYETEEEFRQRQIKEKYDQAVEAFGNMKEAWAKQKETFLKLKNIIVSSDFPIPKLIRKMFFLKNKPYELDDEAKKYEKSPEFKKSYQELFKKYLDENTNPEELKPLFETIGNSLKKVPEDDELYVHLLAHHKAIHDYAGGFANSTGKTLLTNKALEHLNEHDEFIKQLDNAPKVDNERRDKIHEEGKRLTEHLNKAEAEGKSLTDAVLEFYNLKDKESSKEEPSSKQDESEKRKPLDLRTTQEKITPEIEARFRKMHEETAIKEAEQYKKDKPEEFEHSYKIAEDTFKDMLKNTSPEELEEHLSETLDKLLTNKNKDGEKLSKNDRKFLLAWYKAGKDVLSNHNRQTPQPKSEPATPTPQPATPTPKPATPTPQPATPTPKPATPTPKPATPKPNLGPKPMTDTTSDGELVYDPTTKTWAAREQNEPNSKNTTSNFENQKRYPFFGSELPKPSVKNFIAKDDYDLSIPSYKKYFRTGNKVKFNDGTDLSKLEHDWEVTGYDHYEKDQPVTIKNTKTNKEIKVPASKLAFMQLDHKVQSEFEKLNLKPTENVKLENRDGRVGNWQVVTVLGDRIIVGKDVDDTIFSNLLGEKGQNVSVRSISIPHFLELQKKANEKPSSNSEWNGRYGSVNNSKENKKDSKLIKEARKHEDNELFKQQYKIGKEEIHYDRPENLEPKELEQKLHSIEDALQRNKNEKGEKLSDEERMAYLAYYKATKEALENPTTANFESQAQYPFFWNKPPALKIKSIMPKEDYGFSIPNYKNYFNNGKKIKFNENNDINNLEDSWEVTNYDQDSKNQPVTIKNTKTNKEVTLPASKLAFMQLNPKAQSEFENMHLLPGRNIGLKDATGEKKDWRVITVKGDRVIIGRIPDKNEKDTFTNFKASEGDREKGNVLVKSLSIPHFLEMHKGELKTKAPESNKDKVSAQKNIELGRKLTTVLDDAEKKGENLAEVARRFFEEEDKK